MHAMEGLFQPTGCAASSSARPPRVTIGGGQPCPSRLVELWRQGDFCDVEVIAEGGQRFRAHRVVLAAGSDYMRALFAIGMSDSTGPVELPEVPEAAFAALIEFLYMGSCACSEETLVLVLQVADRLQVPPLLAGGARAAMVMLRPDTCLALWSMAAQLPLPDLERRAKAMALEHFEEVATTKEFTQLPIHRLARLLEQERLRAKSEEKVFEALLAWLHAQDPPVEEAELESLLALVRFPTMEPAYVYNLLWQEPALMRVAGRAFAHLHQECPETLRKIRRRRGAVYEKPELVLPHEVGSGLWLLWMSSLLRDIFFGVVENEQAWPNWPMPGLLPLPPTSRGATTAVTPRDRATAKSRVLSCLAQRLDPRHRRCRSEGGWLSSRLVEGLGWELSEPPAGHVAAGFPGEELIIPESAS